MYMKAWGHFTRLLFAALTVAAVASGDDLVPPGPPGSEATRMKTLNQVEPRKLIEGIPFTISNPGSYYFAQNMYATSGITGILVESSDVNIDLCGFALIGTNGSFDGIRIQGSNENISIRNGSIRNWGQFGINGLHADDGAVIDVKAHRNGYGGILFGEGSMIAGCTAYGNGYGAPLPPSFTPINPDQDTDDDGMPDGFEQRIIDFSANDSIATFEDVWPYYQAALDVPTGSHSPVYWDFDGDNYDNSMENMDGTDPTDPNDNAMNNSTCSDTDYDGLQDNWEQSIITNDINDEIATIYDVWPWYDPNLDMPAGSQTNSHWDYDHDDFENMAEFQGGSDPTDPESTPENAAGNIYTNYVEPPDTALYDDFVDPEDEPNDDGIRTGGFSTIKECKARRNRGSGIYAEYGSRIEDCVSAGNLADGIHVSSYATVGGCTVARNLKDGITIVSKCRVLNNNCGQNGQLHSQAGAMPRGAGIRILSSGNRVENNNLSGNAIGIHVDSLFASQGTAAGSNLIIGNSCVDNWGGAFDLSTGDFMGGQYYQGDVADPGSTTNSATMDADNPFTNFRF